MPQPESGAESTSTRMKRSQINQAYHEFRHASPECVIGEISTANDDARDNFFADPNVGRFPEIEEDEPPELRLVSESRQR